MIAVATFSHREVVKIVGGCNTQHTDQKDPYQITARPSRPDGAVANQQYRQQNKRESVVRLCDTIRGSIADSATPGSRPVKAARPRVAAIPQNKERQRYRGNPVADERRISLSMLDRC